MFKKLVNMLKKKPQNDRDEPADSPEGSMPQGIPSDAVEDLERIDGQGEIPNVDRAEEIIVNGAGQAEEMEEIEEIPETTNGAGQAEEMEEIEEIPETTNGAGQDASQNRRSISEPSPAGVAENTRREPISKPLLRGMPISRSMVTIQMKKQGRISREDIQAAMQANNEAVQAKKLGDVDAALRGYEKALELYPQYAIAYYNRALLHQENDDLESALIDSARAIEINPRDPEFYNNRGNTHSKLGKPEQALEDYRQAVHLSPNHSESYHNRAWAYVQMGDLATAVEDLKRAVELNPDLVADYFNLACLHARIGDARRAFEFLEKALRKGYRNWEKLRSDPDLEPLRATPALEDLLDLWQETG